jgi:hypothetical protein
MPGAAFEQGRFHAHDDYGADDLETYSAGAITLLDASISRGGTDLLTGMFYITPAMGGGVVSGYGNYGSDDFEQEAVGSIGSLHEGTRSGDTLLKNGKFH